MRAERLLSVLATPAVGLAGCGGGDSAEAPASAALASTQAAGVQVWKRVFPGGDCQCSDGSKFSFWIRKANPSTRRG
jgi:hypothetical protein